MPLPKWVTDPVLTDQERTIRMLKYQLRLAALHHNEQGSLPELSEAAGFHDTYLRVSINRGHLSRKAALAVESVVGQEVFSASRLTSY